MMRLPIRIAGAAAILAGLLAVTGPGARAQENATVTGTVTDPTGAVVPGVQLTLTNTATEQTRQAVSNSSGIYLFSNLGVGTYALKADKAGFRTFSRTGIVVNVAQTLSENVALEVGSAGQTITVRANALQLQSQTSDVSTLISGRQVLQLATNGRNVTQLAALGMGVSNTLPSFGGVNALTSASGISFNGTRSSHNVYLLDGAEMNDRGCGGCFMDLPSVDALAEFRTLDSNYPPDYGLGSGGIVTMVIKSGTSKFHGEAWEFNRNEVYDANNYFSNLAGQPRPEFRLNEPGFNVGGPLWIPHLYNTARNRTFFFVNEEWRRLVEGSTPTTTNTIMASDFPTAGQDLHYTVPAGGAAPVVPTTGDPARVALYGADHLTPGQPFPRNADGTYTIPANLMDPNAVLEVNAGTFPRPNLGTSQYISSIPQPTNVREDVVRIDHRINQKFQLMGHFLHDAVSQTYYPPLWSDSSYPTVGSTLSNPSYSAVVKLTQTYSPSVLNETTFNYGGNKITLTPIAGRGGSFVQPSGWSASTFFPAADNELQRMPEIDLQGTPLNVNWSSSYFPWKNGYEAFEYMDDISWIRGRHQFKFGFSWLHDYKNQQLQANTQGTAVFSSSAFSGDSYVNFLLGDASSFTQLQLLLGKHWVNNNYSGYGEDNWHVTNHLTLNLGLRYDALPHAFERYNQFANFVPADYDPAVGATAVGPDGTLNPADLTTYNGEPFYLNGMREAGVNGFPRGNVRNRYFTWEPRVGFALQLGASGHSVLRGGAGLFYERVQGNDVYNAALNPPFAYQPSADNVYFSNPHTSALTGGTTTQAFPSTLTSIRYNYPPPGTADFSLGIQHQLAPSVVAAVQYVGSVGWDQNDDRHINTLPLNAVGERQGVANGSLLANRYRIYQGYSDIAQEENETNFSYHSLQAGLRIENRHGITAQFAYTYSHEIDEVSGDLSSLSDPFNARYDRGSGALDRRHIFNASYIYAFPFYLHGGNAFQRTVLGGWEFSGITQAETGVPVRITYTGADTLGLGGGTTNRPNQVAAVHYPKTRQAWFTTGSFADPLAPWSGGGNEGFGNAGKDAVRGPGLLNFNWSMFKTIPLSGHETPNLELRFESFNTFNHTEFGGTGSNDGLDVNSHDPNFGQVTSAYDGRVLQLGGKIHF